MSGSAENTISEQLTFLPLASLAKTCLWAGKRAGLAGSRSGLFWEVVRILGELRPAWVVLENVPGLFSSNEGRDFAVVLESLDELGYGLAWRVLDSQFFGVAQRRRRVFIVGSFGKPCPAEVLFESEGGEGDFAEGGEERAELAYEVAASLRGAGGGPRGFNLDAETGLAVSYSLRSDPGGTGQGHDTTYAIAENCRGELRTSRISPALSGGGGKPGSGYPCVATALSSRAGHHGHSSPRGDGSDNLVVKRRGGFGWSEYSDGTCPTLESTGGSHQGGSELTPIAIQDVRGHRDKKQNGIGIDESGGAMYTLDGTSQHAVASLSGMGSGGPDDNDGQAGRIVSASADTNRVRDVAGLPLGLDSARYRALGNAVTAKVATWIGRRIVACHERTGS